MDLDIPYTAEELRPILDGLQPKMEKELLNDEAEDRIATHMADVANIKDSSINLNQYIAKYKNISVQELVESEDYEAYLHEYRNVIVTRFVKAVTEETNLDEKEAYAIIATISGEIT